MTKFVKLAASLIAIALLLYLVVAIGKTSSGYLAATTPQAGQATWEYVSQTDKMTGALLKQACLPSTNRLQFRFPYNGGSRAEICFTNRRNGEAGVVIDKGQFLCGLGCNVKVKFDGGPTRNFTATPAADGSANVVFIVREHEAFLASTRQAKHVKVQAVFYQEGEQVMEFDSAGLNWEGK